MSPRDIVGSLHKAALSAARRQAGAAGFAIGVAKGVAARGGALAESLLPGRSSATGPGEVKDVEVSSPAGGAATPAAPEQSTASASTPAAQPDEQSADKQPDEQPDEQSVAAEPQVVLREPAPPAQPPVDIVEQVLAAEQEEEQPMGGRAGEPKGASRDETHGDATMQRAEIEEIAEEVAEASPEGDLDLATPVGTTGADAGRNPDTAEADLQQPGTEPLVDPATTKAVGSEQETLSEASRSARER